MLGFVKEMALRAWVGLEGAARAVRLSAQANGYRHYVSVCGTCGVGEGLFAEGLLGFLKDLAVCWGSDEWEDESVGCGVERILAHRRFVSVKPGWMFRQSLGVEGGSDSEVEDEGSWGDLSEPLSADEIESGFSSVFENEAFSTEIQEEESEIYQEQMQEGRELCLINRQDYSILDLDEEYGCMTSFDPDGAGEDNFSKKYFFVHDLCMDSSLQEVDIDVGIECTRSISHVTDTNQIEVVDDLSTNSSSKESDIRMEMVKDTNQIEEKRPKFHEDESANSSQCRNTEYKLGSTVSSSGDISQSVHRASDITFEESITPHLAEGFPRSPSRNCAHSSGERDDLRLCARNNIISVSQGSQCGLLDTISSLAEASDEPVVKKRRCDSVNSSSIPISAASEKFSETTTCLEGKLLRNPESESQTSISDVMLKINADQSEPLNTNSCTISQQEATEAAVAKKRTMAASLRKIEFSPRMMSFIHFASDEVLSHFNDIVASKATDKDNTSCGFKASRKKLHRQMIPDWHRCYASPLTRSGSNSPFKARKSPSDDKINSFPKSLHMKFPRDFTLPSREALEKKFEMFGPLNYSKTKIFAYTGAAQVVFCRQNAAFAAYEYVKKRNLFGQANVRFWVDRHENMRNGMQSKPTVTHSSLNLKSCLKRPERDKGRDTDKEKLRVRFSLEKKPVSTKFRD
ncbi:uncharacterized protein A4U43_C05F330 [Asparagus officinalis]|uniref:Uncharacterized protein n=1 Tax=Asparagus officinalis TaxID=4686 RepID=A0A5P1ENU5_ASPOF|nr:uncharacterized protein LOC109843303 [Asparagus officinalis]ONK67464.1 uncharacterized protein A4U43_C05F330 [Asparagus officinalis]